MKVLKDNEVVDHIPRDFSKDLTSALLCGGPVECVVIGKRRSKRGNGLEVPCKRGPEYMLTNIGQTNC